MPNHYTREVPEVSDAQREELEGWLRRRNTAQALALRARIVLQSAAGRSDQVVAQALGTTRATVGKWRRRFLRNGCDGLLDEPRPGAPRRVSDEDVERVVVRTLETTPRGATHWSRESMARACGLSASTVGRVWRAFALKPHRSETFKLSRDPLFIEKVRDIVGLYLHPPERAVVLCVDEKSQIQALNRTQSSPKLQVFNTALITARAQTTLGQARRDSAFWGRLVESAIGAHLANAAASGDCAVHYWRDRNREVDFVVQAGRTIVAIEVKSGRAPEALPGMAAFSEAFRPARTLLVGGDGIDVETFLTTPSGTGCRARHAMEEESFLRRIRTEFPDLRWTSHRYLTHGWDHAVLILDEALVFRAPKTQAYRDALANEARLLRYLQPRVAVGIPDYTYQSADGSFAGYPLLAGRELAVATFRRLSEDERGRIADELAAFLTAVHETPKSVARQYGVSEQDPRNDHEDLVRDVEALVLPRLAAHEVRVVRTFLAELATELAPACPTALVHGDLSGEHILWNAAKQRVSVIDFSDRSIGDPALDFAGLLAYGHGFAQRVVEQYRGPSDEGTLRRAQVYFRRTSLETMADALQGYPCTFEEGYAEFKARYQ